MHAAGSVAYDEVAGLTEGAASAIAAPKLAAAAAVAAAAGPHRAAPTADVWLLSSTAAAWAQPGAGHYAAGSAALVSAAAAATAAGQPVSAPMLGPFGGAGMAASLSTSMSALGLRPLPPREAPRALARCVGAPPGAVVAALDGARFAAVNTTRGPWDYVEAVGLVVDDGDGEREAEVEPSALPPPPPPSSSTPTLTLAAITVAVLAAAADVLGRPLPPGGRFVDAGLDSLAAVELAASVSRATRAPLPPTVAYDCPTADALAAHVHGVLEADRREGDGGAIAAVPRPVVAAAQATTATNPPVTIALFTRLPAGFTRDAARAVPLGRWDADPPPGRPRAARFGGWLAGVAACDASAIGLAPPEAATVDPQQRLLLEAAASALTFASDASTTTTASVFVGIQQMEYGGLSARVRSPLTAYAATSAASVAAGRLAYTYGLTGEAVAVDNACSSALVAAHLGAARARATALATARGCSLAAGVNLALAETTSAAATLAGMLCADGRCKALDAAADGYGRAEACVALWLECGNASSSSRPLLAGSAVNQDGRSAGLTAPSGPAQAAVLTAARAEAGAPRTSLELHGTGTPLGDPIELGAAASVLMKGGGCTLLRAGGAKSRVGHAEPAAGAVGLAAAIAAATGSPTPPLPLLRSVNRTWWHPWTRLVGRRLGWCWLGRPRRAMVAVASE